MHCHTSEAPKESTCQGARPSDEQTHPALRGRKWRAPCMIFGHRVGPSGQQLLYALQPPLVGRATRPAREATANSETRIMCARRSIDVLLLGRNHGRQRDCCIAQVPSHRRELSSERYHRRISVVIASFSSTIFTPTRRVAFADARSVADGGNGAFGQNNSTRRMLYTHVLCSENPCM